MKKFYFILFLLSCIYFFGCTPDITTVQVVRNPVLKFDFNGTSTWQYKQYNFGPLSQTVVYPEDTTQPGQLYNRFTLQATGNDNEGNTLQLIITFDVANTDVLVGTYTTQYTTERGLAQVQLFNITDAGNLAAYELCDDNIADATLQIQKQKPDERLITGVFHMTLCNLRNASDKIDINNGIITDITY